MKQNKNKTNKHSFLLVALDLYFDTAVRMVTNTDSNMHSLGSGWWSEKERGSKHGLQGVFVSWDPD